MKAFCDHPKQCLKCKKQDFKINFVYYLVLFCINPFFRFYEIILQFLIFLVACSFTARGVFIIADILRIKQKY